MKDNTIRAVKNSVKRGARDVGGKLRIQLGKRALTVPGTVRLVESQNYLFLTIPMSTGIYKIGENGLEQLADEALAPQDLVREMREATRPKPQMTANKLSPGDRAKMDEALAQVERAQLPAGWKWAVKEGQLVPVKGRPPKAKAADK